jgi:paraquat-inducible protein B
MSTPAKPAVPPAMVGAFVVGGIVLGLAAVVLFGNVRLFNQGTAACVVFQGSVNGLAVGAPVTFRGVNIGSVTRIVIEFDQRTHVAYIPVTIELEPDHVRVTHEDTNDLKNMEKMVALGLRAELDTESIVTGQSEIELDFNPSAPAVLHPGLALLPEIPTQESPLDKIKTAISDLPLRALSDNADASLKSLRTLSDKLDVELPPLLESLRRTSDMSGAAVGTLVNTVTDLQAKLSVTLAAVTALADNGTTAVVQRSADLRVLLGSANRTFQQAHAVLGDVQEMTSRRSAARVNLEATLSDLAAASASLRGFASDVEHDPQLLLTGRRR